MGEPVALYTRVSSAHQVENYSLPFQRDQLLEYCRHHALDPVGVYEDAGISGATVADRPALQRLIADARRGQFRQVVIYRVDRFTRADPWDLFPLVKAMQDLGIRLVSASEQFDLADENGQLIFQILANFALRERNAIRARTLGGKQASARQGRYTGGHPPFGYRVEAGRFVPDETPWTATLTKADVIRTLFAQYVARDSVRSVLEWLEAEGIPPLASAWNRATIIQILSHPVYKGDYAWGRRAYPARGPSVWRPPDAWITRAANHVPLVDAALWDQVAHLRAQRQRGGRHALRERHLLDGLLVCAVCGSVLSRRNSGDYVYYTCGSRFNAVRRRKGTACTTFPYWRADDMRTAVWQFCAEAVTARGPLSAAVQARNAGARPLLQAAERARRAAQARRETIRQQEARLLDLAIDGGFSADVLAAKQAALADQRAIADRAWTQAEHDWVQAQAAAATGLWDPAVVRTALQRFLHHTATEAERRAVLQQVLGAPIAVDPSGDVTITLRLPLDSGREPSMAIRRHDQFIPLVFAVTRHRYARRRGVPQG